jgi:hypothetical protein
MSRSIFLLRMKNIAHESCRENRRTYFIFDHCFSGSRAVCEIMWKNYVARDSPQMTIWRMRIPYWIPKATNAHSQCVILLFHGSSDCTNAPQYYVILTLTVFIVFVFLFVCLCVLCLCSVLDI